MAIYVSNWGNDINDGSDLAHAKKSIQGAKDTGASTIYAKGFFQENANGIEGIGVFVLYNPLDYIDVTNASNATIMGKVKINDVGNNSIFLNCKFNNNQIGIEDNVLIANSDSISWLSASPGYESTYFTIYNTNFLHKPYHGNAIKNFIISKSNIDWQKAPEGVPSGIYSLFNLCKFKFSGGDQNADETSFTYPMGGDTPDDTATDEEKMQNLRNRAATVYGGNAEDYFQGCQYYSGPATDIFNDPANDDYTLKPGTIATYMSYDGYYVGKYPPSLSWKFPDDFQNITNFTGNKITDQSQNASADGIIKDLGAVRKITNLPLIDSPAYRNGVNLNTDNVLQDGEITSGNIQAGHVYYVNGSEGDSITYNGTTYNYNEYFVGVDGVTTFTGSEIVREVYYTDYKRAMQWKFSLDDADLSGATKITMLAGQKPMVNTDQYGEPTAGNGDDSFDSSTAVELSARYMQPFILYLADQLRAY